jgi:glycerol-3-phosphate dehydrogenase
MRVPADGFLFAREEDCLNSRTEKLALLEDRFDVLIVGGGATGLGLAVDAATRGYRTVLVEAGDFAQATSSRATKLVHGGVRYLASGQIPLVYEALRERKTMLSNAPHLVHTLPFVTPAYRWFDLPWYGAGLTLYDLLSGSASLGPTKILSVRETRERIPGIATAGLKGSVMYHDAQFDDARLALALARTAEDHGAVVLNYVRCTELLKQEGRICGARVQDVETGDELTVHAAAVINATGIFVDALRQQDTAGLENLLSVSRGTHLVVAGEFLQPNGRGEANAIMVPKTEDGRIIFAIPWLGKVVIGTTDLPAAKVEMEPGHEDSEIEFLLETINPFLSRPVAREDILSIFSGLRPLVTGKQSNTSKLSREHHIDISPSGLVTVAGGKWTTYRRMAEGTLNFAIKHNLLPTKECVSKRVRLHGAPTPAEANERRGQTHSQYGMEAAAVNDLIRDNPAMATVLDEALPYTVAEVVYAVHAEMARTVEDVLSRRTRALLLDARAAERAAPAVARVMASELGWGQDWVESQVASFTDLARRFYLVDQGPAPTIAVEASPFGSQTARVAEGDERHVYDGSV